MARGSIVLLLALVLSVASILVGCSPVKSTAEWHSNQGSRLFEQGRYDEVIEECTKANELDPKCAMACSSLFRFKPFRVSSTHFQ